MTPAPAATVTLLNLAAGFATEPSAVAQNGWRSERARRLARKLTRRSWSAACIANGSRLWKAAAVSSGGYPSDLRFLQGAGLFLISRQRADATGAISPGELLDARDLVISLQWPVRASLSPAAGAALPVRRPDGRRGSNFAGSGSGFSRAQCFNGSVNVALL